MAAGELEETRAQRVTDITDEPLEFIAPITGYEKEPLVSLEQATKPLVKILPTIESRVYVAKQKCRKPADNLTQDESAAIMLYTMGWQPRNESQNGITIVGGCEASEATNQLHSPLGLYIDEEGTMFIADQVNQRIVQWKSVAMSSEVVAGNKGKGDRLDQLNTPTDMIVDKEGNSLIICDWGNKRVMRWSLRIDTTNGEILISNIRCFGLTMDDQRFLYVSDQEKHEVRRYKIGETTGTVVAGGNGKGDRLNQLNWPRYIFADQDYSVYVSDCWNHRVIKWTKGAKEGIVVAGGRGEGNALNQLSLPNGLFVDSSGSVYVADGGNNRVTCWRKGATQGELVVGGNGEGSRPNQFNYPGALSFDSHGNLFVVDNSNHRVQSFSFEKNELL
ncbi:unnamed protein product [Rotaria sp. Silwood2]|nr:unnamed protein product [Rotaria sp. Silwood2]